MTMNNNQMIEILVEKKQGHFLDLTFVNIKKKQTNSICKNNLSVRKYYVSFHDNGIHFNIIVIKHYHHHKFDLYIIDDP